MDDALLNDNGAAGSPWLASHRWCKTVVEEGRGREEEGGPPTPGRRPAAVPRSGFRPNGPCGPSSQVPICTLILTFHFKVLNE